jgi:molecular chaperone DnaK
LPQIEVTFDLDANGILHVSAKDKATGKENKIVIKSSSGLGEAEIEQMVNDAEAHAEEDKKARELVEARNQADAMIHGVRKSMSEMGDKLDADEKEKIESAIKDLESVVKDDDKAAIEQKTQALGEASHKMAEQMYAQASEAEATASAEAETSSGESKDDNVVDAEFEEVKDDKAKK